MPEEETPSAPVADWEDKSLSRRMDLILGEEIRNCQQWMKLRRNLNKDSVLEAKVLDIKI